MLSRRWFVRFLAVVIVGGFLAWQAPRWAGQPALDEAACGSFPTSVKLFHFCHGRLLSLWQA